jgi:HlyD family secretion protein
VLAAEDLRWVPAETDGRVERVVEQPGVSVRADTLLIEISNPELLQATRDVELQMRAAYAELRARQIQFERDVLLQRSVTATARAEYEEARLRANADAELAQAGLISPLTVKFSRGKESQLAVRVDVEEKRLELAARGKEADLANAKAKVDQLRALVSLKQHQLESLHVRAGRDGVLQQIAVEVGQRVSSGTTLAKIEVDRATDALYVGRPVQSEPNGTVVLFLIAPDGTTAVRRQVRVGRASYDAIEVLRGLAAGDRVVLSDTSAYDRFDRITISN